MDKWTVLSSSALAVLVLAGCASTRSESNQAKLPPFSHPRDITNRYLPLASLKQDILRNDSERVERTARPEISKTFMIDGQSVAALAVEDREFSPAGELKEATVDYFAQDDEGNVYYLGEDVNEYHDGKITGHSGAWLLGRDTSFPGLLMPAHPKVGDRFKSENVPPITVEKDEVVSINERASGSYGEFGQCVKIKEFSSDGDTEYKLYAPGIGCVAEIEGRSMLKLESHQSR